jgi:Fe-S-cluster containining protein
MYSRVEVRDGDELEVLTTAGLAFAQKDGETCFTLPCPAFGGGRCSIYDGRPAVCRNYRCLLLRRHEAGEVPHDVAAALIAKTIAQRDRVRSGLAGYVDSRERLSLGRLYRLMLAKLDAQPDPAAARREQAELLLEVVALRVLLSREFEPRDSKSHQPDEAPE